MIRCLCLLSSGSRVCVVFFFKQKTAYELRISDWSSDVCSSDLFLQHPRQSDGQSARRASFHRLRGRRRAAADRRGRGDLGDRKSVVSGTSVSVRVDLGGRRSSKKKTTTSKRNAIRTQKHER